MRFLILDSRDFTTKSCFLSGHFMQLCILAKFSDFTETSRGVFSFSPPASGCFIFGSAKIFSNSTDLTIVSFPFFSRRFLQLLHWGKCLNLEWPIFLVPASFQNFG